MYFVSLIKFPVYSKLAIQASLYDWYLVIDYSINNGQVSGRLVKVVALNELLFAFLVFIIQWKCEVQTK